MDEKRGEDRVGMGVIIWRSFRLVLTPINSEEGQREWCWKPLVSSVSSANITCSYYSIILLPACCSQINVSQSVCCSNQEFLLLGDAIALLCFNFAAAVAAAASITFQHHHHERIIRRGRRRSRQHHPSRQRSTRDARTPVQLHGDTVH